MLYRFHFGFAAASAAAAADYFRYSFSRFASISLCNNIYNTDKNIQIHRLTALLDTILL